MTEIEILEIINEEIIQMLSGRALQAFNLCIKSEFLSYAQDHANIVSIKRLKMNDHGKVHMRKTTHYAILISHLLKSSEIQLSGQSENWCEYDDSLTAIIIAAFMHDIGMGIHRQNHEFYSLMLVNQQIDTILDFIYPEIYGKKKFGIKSLIIESIAGHMGHQQISSLEAGILLVADGCDLEYGRAKPAANLSINARVGDIHRYSASCVTKVSIMKGDIKPVKILIQLKEYAGFFQIEEILMQKMAKSTIKEFVEVVGYLDEYIIKKYS